MIHLIQNISGFIEKIQMFEIEKIHPKIFIFKNVIKNPEKIIEHYCSNFYSWEPWYTFGAQVNLSNLYFEFDSFPQKNEWEKKINLIGKNEIADFVSSFIKKNIQNKGEIGLNEEHILFLKESENKINEITNLFYETTSLYIKETNIEKENLIFNPFNVAKYYDNAGVSDDLSMNYHTDFVQHQTETLDYNFYVTCLFYLNDNYEGGEISFKVLDRNQKNIVFSKDYKPVAGDIVVFPSTPPFYHGVKKSKNEEKYIIRTYWKNKQGQDFKLKNEENNYFYVGDHVFQGFQDIL